MEEILLTTVNMVNESQTPTAVAETFMSSVARLDPNEITELVSQFGPEVGQIAQNPILAWDIICQTEPKVKGKDAEYLAEVRQNIQQLMGL